MTLEESKKLIDSMSYEALLTRWRFAPAGDFLLQKPVGDYFAEVMNKKRDELPDGEHTRISKSIGWNR